MALPCLVIFCMRSDFLSQTGHMDLWMSVSTVWCTSSFATKCIFVNETFFFGLLRLFELLKCKKKKKKNSTLRKCIQCVQLLTGKLLLYIKVVDQDTSLHSICTYNSRAGISFPLPPNVNWSFLGHD